MSKRSTAFICHGSPGISRYERVDEWPRGNLPFPRYVHSGFSPLRDWITSWCRAPEEELLYVLYKLLELRLWPESLWASLSTTTLKCATDQRSARPVPFFRLRADVSSLPIDTSLPASEVIADSVTTPSSARPAHEYSCCSTRSCPSREMVKRLSYG